ncbi:hypothetical protein NMG60_11014543 [Bertholletia excelsa]
MENNKQLCFSSSSSPSFTADHTGFEESTPTPPLPPAGRFASIFPPASSVVDGNSSYFDFSKDVQKQPSGDQVWRTKQGPQEVPKSSEGKCNIISDKERSTIFQQRAEPSPLSSSIHYGGREDMYIRSTASETLSTYPSFDKCPAEDDPIGNSSNWAYRGNWWQGSLYY